MMGWRPDIAVVTNFAPNHLDVHDGLDDYRACKQQILLNQSAVDVAVLNVEDAEVLGWKDSGEGRVKLFGLSEADCEGVFVEENAIVSRSGGRSRTICNVDDLLLPGRHNQANACAAACAAVSAGVGLDIVAEVLATFEGVEHRLERCETRDGVTFYNDSIATSPERTMMALRALDRPIVLIAGGSDKGLNYEEMGRLVSERTKQVVLIGETAEKIAKTIHGVPVENAEDLERAVQIAARASVEGDVVLLSPASASYDQFANFEDRGRQFKRFVSQLR